MKQFTETNEYIRLNYLVKQGSVVGFSESYHILSLSLANKPLTVLC